MPTTTEVYLAGPAGAFERKPTVMT